MSAGSPSSALISTTRPSSAGRRSTKLPGEIQPRTAKLRFHRHANDSRAASEDSMRSTVGASVCTASAASRGQAVQSPATRRRRDTAARWKAARYIGARPADGGGPAPAAKSLPVTPSAKANKMGADNRKLPIRRLRENIRVVILSQTRNRIRRKTIRLSTEGARWRNNLIWSSRTERWSSAAEATKWPSASRTAKSPRWGRKNSCPPPRKKSTPPACTSFPASSIAKPTRDATSPSNMT